MAKLPKEKWYKIVLGATSKTVYLGTNLEEAVASMTSPKYHYVRHEAESKDGPWFYLANLPNETGKQVPC